MKKKKWLLITLLALAIAVPVIAQASTLIAC
jgi:hypothetical protein